MSRLERDWTRAMREGNYDHAWLICERVLAERNPETRDDRSLPCHLRWVWDGRPFDGRHVLVRCYHGLGDTIQFARYLPQLRRRAASVTLEAQPRLAGVLEDIGVDRLVPFDPAHPLPESDCDIEIMELPFALRTPPRLVRPPYVHAPPALLPNGTIGLCFEAGNWDRDRSIPPDLLRPICAKHPCISLVSRPADLPLLNRHGCPYDMAVTTSLVAGLDLVITVDTMIAHLAGAMNKPVWLLLKHEPDWRWSPSSRRSDWYPSMRLYRQQVPGDWASVVAEVARDLDAMAAEQSRESMR